MSQLIHTASDNVKPRPKAPSRDPISGDTYRGMALSKAEWERRLKAILTLKGMDLADLKHVVHEHGLPVNAAARAGHESDELMPSDALALVVARILDVPVSWFEAEDWRSQITPARAADDALQSLRLELLKEIRGLRSELRGELAKEHAARVVPPVIPAPGSTAEGLTGP